MKKVRTKFDFLFNWIDVNYSELLFLSVDEAFKIYRKLDRGIRRDDFEVIYDIHCLK